MLQKEIYNNLFNKKANIVNESLSAKEKIFAQISHHVLEWLLKGKSPTSYLSTKQAEYDIADIIKQGVEKTENHAENRLIALYDDLEYLIDSLKKAEYDKNDYMVKKAKQEIDGRFDIFYSTNIGDAMVDEIIRKVK